MKNAQKIFPHFWFVKDAEKAAEFYVSIFPDSKIDRVASMQSESPSGGPGTVKVVDFTLLGQRFQCMAAGKHHDFNDALSMVVECADQQEIDRYWNAILDGGGKEQACGWIIDRHGVRWQIVPAIMSDMMASDDKAASKRATDAMLEMKKFDVEKLKAAFDGK